MYVKACPHCDVDIFSTSLLATVLNSELCTIDSEDIVNQSDVTIDTLIMHESS